MNKKMFLVIICLFSLLLVACSGEKGKADNEFMVSAFLNKGSKSLVIVVINMKPDNQTIVFKGLPKGTPAVWETSEKLSLVKKANYLGEEPFTISPESITTLHISM